MFCVSSFRLCVTTLSLAVAICSSGWLVAQELPFDDSGNGQLVVDAEETQAQEDKPSISDRPAQPVRVPRNVTRQLVDIIVPAMQAGDDVAFLNAAMPLISKIKPQVLGALDDLSIEHGVQPIQSRFVDLVLQRAEQGDAPTRVVSDLQTSRIVFDGLVSKLNKFAESFLSHDVMSDPLEVPSGFQESERLFWDLHVLDNEFQNVIRSISLGQTILSRHENTLKRAGEWQQLATDLTEANIDLMVNYSRFKERAAALRLQRFEEAHNVLVNDTSAEFELNLTSAMELEQDASVLLAFLQDNSANLTIESLRAEGLETRIQTMLSKGREAAGDIATKANLFRNGLRYWARGRYGSGPEVFGLVKSRQAMNSVEAMEALYMPRERKLPISNYHSEETSVPGYDRRHYYTWAAEYRPIIGRTGGTTRTSKRSTTQYGPTSNTNRQQFL